MAVASPPAGPAVDLGVRRDLSALIGDSIELWRRNVAAFLSLALVVVAPAVLVIEYYTPRVNDGLQSIQDQMKATADGSTPAVHFPAGFFTAVAIVLAVSFVQGPLITAIHARAVVALSKAPTIEVGAAIRDAAPVIAIAFIAELGAVLLSIASLVAFPYVLVRLQFAAQAAAVDGRLSGSLRGSWSIVRGQWWRTLGLLLLFSLMAAIANGIVGGISTAVLPGALGLAARVVVQGVTASVMALAMTLLFFDLRVRAGVHPGAATPAEAPAW